MTPLKVLAAVLAGAVGVVAIASPGATGEQSFDRVAEEIRAGVQSAHGYEATPHFVFEESTEVPERCNVVEASRYCQEDRTIYLNREAARAAGEYGDAAIAFAISREYARAVQYLLAMEPDAAPIARRQTDCLAGYYLGTMSGTNFDPDDMSDIERFAEASGESAIAPAVLLGMQAALEGGDTYACLAFDR